MKYTIDSLHTYLKTIILPELIMVISGNILKIFIRKFVSNFMPPTIGKSLSWLPCSYTTSSIDDWRKWADCGGHMYNERSSVFISKNFSCYL
jgi:hypothetical protein